jgi:hypothetical protein
LGIGTSPSNTVFCTEIVFGHLDKLIERLKKSSWYVEEWQEMMVRHGHLYTLTARAPRAKNLKFWNLDS